jgi:hypothetical protein
MLFKCRTVKPKLTEWREVEAESPEVAANDFHSKWQLYFDNLKIRMGRGDGRTYLVHFVVVEIEGHGEQVSRIFEYGIWRAGGVKKPEVPLKTRQHGVQ